MIIRNDKKGFTLIEILVVIGIIAVLAAVVLVAVNPTRQFKLARDSQRVANVNTILNAVHQNISEHKGNLVCASIVRFVPSTPTMITSPAIQGEQGVPGDLAPCLVPDYVSALPFDPSITTAHYTSDTNYDTGYQIYQDSTGRVTVVAIGSELTPSISVTR